VAACTEADLPRWLRASGIAHGRHEATRLARVIEYQNFKGERWVYPLWQQMVHQVNHATQHRSEVAMILTQWGHSPGWLDLLYFVDLHGSGASVGAG